MKYFQTKTATSATTVALRSECQEIHGRLYFFIVSNQIKHSIVLLKEMSLSKFEIGLRPQAGINLWVLFLFVCLYFIGLDIAGYMSVLLELVWKEYTFIMRSAGMYVSEVQRGPSSWKSLLYNVKLHTAVQETKIPSHFMSHVYCR
jgi:hypothetical protein